MAMKLISVLLTILVVVSANEKVKRESGMPDQFNEFINKVREQFKPIAGNFPSMPNGFGSFPNFPGSQSGNTGSGEASPSKRQINQQSFEEFLNKVKETGNKFAEKFPTGQFPSGQFPSGQFPTGQLPFNPGNGQPSGY